MEKVILELFCEGLSEKTKLGWLGCEAGVGWKQIIILGNFRLLYYFMSAGRTLQAVFVISLSTV